MISLKKYLNRDTPETDRESQYRRMIDLFLQGIGLHAIEGDKGEYDRFRIGLTNLEKSITAETPLSDMFVSVGSALRSMEDYNQSASKLIRRQNSEYQLMLSMLTKTVISIGSSSECSVDRLQDIEKAMEHTSRLEDFQALKTRLGECLTLVRQESFRQKQDGQTAMQALQQELEGSRERLGSTPFAIDVDAATGLPGKTDAIRAINTATDSPTGKFVVIAVVNRVQAVNARFGYAVGDKVLAAFAQHFLKGLAAKDKVFRWQGPSLLALLERAERIEQVRTEIRGFTEVKLDTTLQVGQRTVLIPIAASWAIFPMEASAESLLKKVETFTAAQVPRDFA
jgi:GGDEF domain-containing protein